VIRRLLALPNDDARKILFVAVALCLVCSLLVSSAAVLLGPAQQAQKDANRKLNVLLAAGLVADGERPDINALFLRIEARLVDLDRGRFSDRLNPATFDERSAARDPQLGEAVPREQDIASIGRRARYATVYLLRDGDRLERVILPVHGYGLWSTMYAYLALDADLKTVAAINFYEQAETPGLGSEVENPRWQALWHDKQVYGPEGEVRLRVVKGSVDPAGDDAAYKVDGLSGATLTGNGVSNMIRYWLGPNGFGPFLDNLANEGA